MKVSLIQWFDNYVMSPYGIISISLGFWPVFSCWLCGVLFNPMVKVSKRYEMGATRGYARYPLCKKRECLRWVVLVLSWCSAVAGFIGLPCFRSSVADELLFFGPIFQLIRLPYWFWFIFPSIVVALHAVLGYAGRSFQSGTNKGGHLFAATKLLGQIVFGRHYFLEFWQLFCHQSFRRYQVGIAGLQTRRFIAVQISFVRLMGAG